MVGTGILSNNMRSPSPKCYTTFWMLTIYSDTLNWSGITPIFDPITDLNLTEFDFLPNCQRFPYNIWNGCGMPTEDAFSSGHLVLSHFWICNCSNVETNLSWTCLFSGLLSFEHPSVLQFLLYTAIPSHRPNKSPFTTRSGYGVHILDLHPPPGPLRGIFCKMILKQCKSCIGDENAIEHVLN